MAAISRTLMSNANGVLAIARLTSVRRFAWDDALVVKGLMIGMSSGKHLRCHAYRRGLRGGLRVD
jgi:hypothetical protein